MGKPVVALALCGAVLLVPLGLAAPEAPPEAGEEVVLAAGSPDGVGPEAAPELVDEATVAVEAEAFGQPESVEPALAEAWTSSSPSATRGSESKARSATAGTSSKAKSASAKKLTGPAKPTPTTEPAAAAATVAVAAQAPPPPPPPPPPAPPQPAPAPPRAVPVAAPSAVDAIWDKLAVCESGNTNDGGAPYYGYWQFSAGTWSSMGEPGLPNDHSRPHQLAAAKRLQSRSGWGQWPACSRKLGLR